MTAPSTQRTIFVACRELGLDNDARHDLQLRVVGKASLSDMTDDERDQVLEELKRMGFKKTRGGKRFKPAPRADLRLVHVLWGLLGKAGKLDRPDRAGLNAFVRSSFGNSWGSVPADIDMLRDADKINAVVRALKSMCGRHGIKHDR